MTLHMTFVQELLTAGLLSLRITLTSLLVASCAVTWCYFVATIKSYLAINEHPENGDILGFSIFGTSFGVGVWSVFGIYTTLRAPGTWASLDPVGLIGINTGIVIASISLSIKIFALVRAQQRKTATGYTKWLAAIFLSWIVGLILMLAVL